MTEIETDRPSRTQAVDATAPEDSGGGEHRPREDDQDLPDVVELTAEIERLKGEIEVMRAEGQAPPSARDVLLRVAMWVATVSVVLGLGRWFGADRQAMAALIFVVVIGVVTVAMVLLTKGK